MEIQTYYQSIYNYLLDAISSGKLSAGDKIPTELELAKQFNVSRITSKKAIKMLEEQGFIIRFRAKGSFVTGKKAALPAGNGKKQLVGIVLSEFSDGFGQRMLYTIEKECGALGYHLVLKFSHDSSALETEAIRELMNMGISGMFIQPVHGEYYNEEILKLVLEKTKMVFIDREMPGLSVPSVISNNTDGARQGIEYLFELGHRHIAAYPSSPIKGTSANEDRWQGYCDAFTKARIPREPALCCDSLNDVQSPLTPIKIIESHLNCHPEITAAFAFDYPTAYTILRAAEKLGKRVPDDLSIVCFDMPDYLKDAPPFTCLYQNEEIMGKRAVDCLHNLIIGKDARYEDTVIPVELIKGRSTASLT
jgi:DNA-binding LacI/PurR family transcriptional regulator